MNCCAELSHQLSRVQRPASHTERWPARMPSSVVKKNHWEVHEEQNESFEVHATQKKVLTVNYKGDIGQPPFLSLVS